MNFEEANRRKKMIRDFFGLMFLGFLIILGLTFYVIKKYGD